MTETPHTNQLINVGMPNMTSHLVNSIAATYISSLTQSGGLTTFSLGTIGKLVAILSIEEAKNQMTDLIHWLRKKIPKVFEYIQKIALSIVFGFIEKFKRRTIEETEEIVEEEEFRSQFNIEWNNVQTHFSFLLSEIQKGESVMTYGEIFDTENPEIRFTKYFSNIVIPVSSSVRMLIDKISVENNEFIKVKNELQPDCLTFYMKNQHMAEQISQHVEAALQYNEIQTKKDGSMSNSQEGYLISLNGNIVHHFEINSITPRDFSLGWGRVVLSLFYIVMYHNKDVGLDGRKVFMALECFVNKNSLFPWYKKLSPLTDFNDDRILCYIYRFCDIKFNQKIRLPPLDKLLKLVQCKAAKVITFQNNALPYKEFLCKRDSVSVTNLSVKLVSDEELSNEQFVEIFTAFLSKNKDTKNETEQEIDIHELKINRYIKTTSTKNPAYELWKEEHEEVVNDDGAGVGVSVATRYFVQPPPMMIDNKEEIVEVVKTAINSVYKSMNTLYLSENIKDHLIRMMDNFLDKKEGLFKRLGIPSKLGICMYGRPGTGKSTTIQAIASYLGKDIFYVNLNGVEKNSELKMLFDEVMKTNSKGGIIVFEDIDCMTDIVKPRTNHPDTASKSITELLNDDELNLSYLLNLLDGTLCAKGTIFIMTTNHIKHLDPALIRPGRVDVKIHLSYCDSYQIKTIWESVMESDLDEEVLSFASSFEFTPADLIFHLIEFVYRLNVEQMDIFMALREKLTAD